MPHCTSLTFTFNWNGHWTKNSTFPNYIPIINCDIDLLRQSRKISQFQENLHRFILSIEKHILKLSMEVCWQFSFVRYHQSKQMLKTLYLTTTINFRKVYMHRHIYFQYYFSFFNHSFYFSWYENLQTENHIKFTKKMQN